MFYEQILSPDDKQKLLTLQRENIVPKVPGYMSSSKHCVMVRYVRMKQEESVQMAEKIVPRVRVRTVLRMVGDLRRGQRGHLLHQFAMLFELGLGVPLQREIAQYLRTYDEQDDKNGVGLKYIRKLVREHVKRYRRSMGGWEWMMPAKYTSQMFAINQFIQLKEGGFKNKVKVPDGIPVVLIYSNTKYLEGVFELQDAFTISPMGFAVPFAQIAMRKEFVAAPKEFVSKSLSGHGMFSMVFGILHWDQKPVRRAQQLLALDDNVDYSVLFDEWQDEFSTPELDAARAKLAELSENIAEHRETLAKLKDKTNLTEAQQAKLKAARRTVNRREAAYDSIDKLEKALAKDLIKTGPVATAKFCAVDIGTIMDKDHFLPVRNPLENINKVLGRWGFETTKTVNTNCSTYLTYSDAANRCWSL